MSNCMFSSRSFIFLYCFLLLLVLQHVGYCRCTDTFAVGRVFASHVCMRTCMCMWANILALIWKSGPRCASYRCRNHTVYNDWLHTLIFHLFLPIESQFTLSCVYDRWRTTCVLCTSDCVHDKWGYFKLIWFVGCAFLYNIIVIPTIVFYVFYYYILLLLLLLLYTIRNSCANLCCGFYAILVQIYALRFFTIYIFANTIKETEFKHKLVSSFIRSYNDYCILCILLLYIVVIIIIIYYIVTYYHNFVYHVHLEYFQSFKFHRNVQKSSV